MITIISYYKIITLLPVFITIISFKICESHKDYDLPLLTEMDLFTKYNNHPLVDKNQLKLTPEQFFMAMYNPWFRVLPMVRPSHRRNYNDYKKMFEESERMIFPETLINKKKQAYDKGMLLDAEIYDIHYHAALDYLNLKNQPLSSEEYFFVLAIYELFPKPYENAEDYYFGRVEFANFLRTYGPKKENKDKTIPNDTDTIFHYDTESFDHLQLFSDKSYIPGESYKKYAMRIVFQGKIPLHPQTYNSVYELNNYDPQKKVSFHDLD